MRNPETAYQWIADAQITVPELLLVPLLANGKEPVGTLWVVAKEPGVLTQDRGHFLGADQDLKRSRQGYERARVECDGLAVLRTDETPPFGR